MIVESIDRRTKNVHSVQMRALLSIGSPSRPTILRGREALLSIGPLEKERDSLDQRKFFMTKGFNYCGMGGNYRAEFPRKDLSIQRGTSIDQMISAAHRIVGGPERGDRDPFLRNMTAGGSLRGIALMHASPPNQTTQLHSTRIQPANNQFHRSDHMVPRSR